MKALTIDDDPDFLKVLEMHLKSIGYRTTAIDSPAEILKSISEEQYNLVLVDWMMPDIDGITIVKAIRTRDRYLGYHTPIIMVTAINNATARTYAQRSGADGYLPKAESPEKFKLELLNTIQSVMSSKSPSSTR